MADVVVVNKVGRRRRRRRSSAAASARRARQPAAPIVRGASPVAPRRPGGACAAGACWSSRTGRRSPTAAWPYGAGFVAAVAAGAARSSIPAPSRRRRSRERLRRAIRTSGRVLPALGYGDAQLAALRETIDAAPADVVVAGDADRPRRAASRSASRSCARATSTPRCASRAWAASTVPRAALGGGARDERGRRAREGGRLRAAASRTAGPRAPGPRDGRAPSAATRLRRGASLPRRSGSPCGARPGRSRRSRGARPARHPRQRPAGRAAGAPGGGLRGGRDAARRARRGERGHDRLPARAGARERAAGSRGGGAPHPGRGRRRRPGVRARRKPIGPVYDSAERASGWPRARRTMAADGGGLRRVVASPVPRRILELRDIALLRRAGVIVVCAGGGGIPSCATRTAGATASRR